MEIIDTFESYKGATYRSDPLKLLIHLKATKEQLTDLAMEIIDTFESYKGATYGCEPWKLLIHLKATKELLTDLIH